MAMGASDRDIQSRLTRMVKDWREERGAMMDAHDMAVTRAIGDAIKLQESDPDPDPTDAKVLSLLKAALKAQQGDTS